MTLLHKQPLISLATFQNSKYYCVLISFKLKVLLVYSFSLVAFSLCGLPLLVFLVVGVMCSNLVCAVSISQVLSLNGFSSSVFRMSGNSFLK